MSRQWRLVVIVAAIMGVVIVMVGSGLVTGLRRNEAVAKLEAKTAVLRKKVNLDKSSSVKQTPEKPEPAGTTKEVPPKEDAAAAFAQLFEERKAVYEDPSWREAIRILEEKDPKEWTAADREKIAAYMRANRDLIKEIARLLELGGPVYPLDFSKGYAMELPHLSKLRDLARLLSADAMILAGEGDYAGAVQDIVMGMRLSQLIADEPILISQLVRVAMDGAMYGAAQSYLQGGDLSPELVQELIRCAGAAANREAFANSFSGEGLFGLEAFESIRTGKEEHSGLLSDGNSYVAVESFLLRLYGSPIARPWLNMDEEDYADIMSRMGEAARLPFYEAKPLFDQIESDIQSLPRTRVLSRTLLPALTRAAQAQARHEAQLDLMRIGLALEQYYAQNGQYPPTLDAVAPAVGGTLPLDPFTGQPFVYQPSGNSFTLYSAMGSVVDAEHRPKRGGGFDENGNIVWRGSQKSLKV